MDLYKVNQDGSRGAQVHDFSPGISSNGLFWIQPTADHTVDGDLEEREAFFRADLKELDAGNIANALHGGPTVPGTVSFRMRWTGTGEPVSFTNATERFTGKFLFSNVSISWSARTEGFSFKSDPASTSVSVAGIMGQERNGVFFDEGGDD